MEKKSFLKGLFIGIGGTLLTALLGITIYGCASINAKGGKAFGVGEVNILTADISNMSITSQTSSNFTIRKAGFSLSDGDEVSRSLLFENQGDYASVISMKDDDDNSIGSCFSFYVKRSGNAFTLEMTCYTPYGVALGSGSKCFVKYGSDSYQSYDWVNQKTVNHSFSANYDCMFTFVVQLEPISGSVDFVYNQPLTDDTSSSSSEASSASDEPSSTSEAIYWEEYTFPRDIYPQEVFPSVTWGNAGYGPDLTGSRNVYLDMQIRYQGEFWDSILFRYIDASSGELTRYHWANGEEAEMGSGALVNPHYFYCASIQLYRTYSVGQSSYGYASYELARVPSAVSNGGTPFQDTRLQWLVNDRTIEVYSADLAHRPRVWSGGFWDSSIDNRQYLNIIGATTSEGGSAGGDDMSGVFDLITEAFGAVAVIFNMQIFPFATLGMFMLIPLVVGIVLFVVGLFKR